MTQAYERHSRVPLADVIEKILANLKRDKAQFEFNGQQVKVVGPRLQTFATKGLVCAGCGKVATHFAIERDMKSNVKKYHLNLWADNEDGTETLFTHDHIIPRSKGGTSNLENTQTMCWPCNNKKADN